jgi:hypothetical protein
MCITTVFIGSNAAGLNLLIITQECNVIKTMMGMHASYR